MPRVATLHLEEDHAQELAPGFYVKLSLIDEGEGVDEATLSRATEPFFTTKGLGKGTGLGLSMVHGLVAQSGGKLQIHNQRGRGTTMSLYLPATVAKRSERRLCREQQERPVTAKLTVLAVDDDPLVLANTAALLEYLGHTVDLAISGEDALEQVTRNPSIDLVVTDQLMPRMTGSQLAARVRLAAPDMPILIVSGFAELGSASGGRFPVLAKPFDGASLAGAIADLQRSSTMIARRQQSSLSM